MKSTPKTTYLSAQKKQFHQKRLIKQQRLYSALFTVLLHPQASDYLASSGKTATLSGIGLLSAALGMLGLVISRKRQSNNKEKKSNRRLNRKRIPRILRIILKITIIVAVVYFILLIAMLYFIFLALAGMS